MAATLPITASGQFPRVSYRRPSVTSSASPQPLSPTLPRSRLLNEIVKNLLQLDLANRIENLRLENSFGDDSPTPLSPSRELGFSASAEQSQSQLSTRSLYKTEICKRFMSNPNSTCEYGIRCRFAHGLRELHLTARHPRYKTELCRAYQLTGMCRYGRRCDFIHNESAYELEILRTENALYQEYCARHPTVKHVTLLEVLREFAPSRPELRSLLNNIESY